MNLFEYQARQQSRTKKPLAERMRPGRLEDFIGQEHAAGPGTLLGQAIARDALFSIVLWGPPGCGKTTLARIIARETESHFIHFSAVLAGIKDIRAVIEEARRQETFHQKRTILFVDEIHRFNKAQQDAFLHHVESGLITLIGATTENPSFEVIAPLLSRCRVITLKPLETGHLVAILKRALADAGEGLGALNLRVDDQALQLLAESADGDARAALGALEAVLALLSEQADAGAAEGEPITVSSREVARALQKKALLYDKGGEEHYNLISAFHKSLRGSDPDAALYWLVRMLDAGEDPLYLARRMVRFASEDVGNADPNALAVALNAMEAFRFIGYPEGELVLAQAATYLATAPKSNSIYMALHRTREAVAQRGALPVPLHIRNAPTRLMKEMGYGKEYRYAHDYKDAFVPQDYLPEKLAGSRFYEPSDRGYESVIKKRLDRWRELKARGERKQRPPHTSS